MSRFVVVALLAFGFICAGCGASLDDDNRDSSNFNPEDWKQETGPAPVAVVDTEKEEANKGPRDPDGLLHRVSPKIHDHLAEVRLDGDTNVLVIFKGGDALKLKGEDLGEMKLLAVDAANIQIRVYKKDYTLRRAQ